MSELEARLAALEHRVGELEDINAIRRLHWADGYYCDFNRAGGILGFVARGARGAYRRVVRRGRRRRLPFRRIPRACRRPPSLRDLVPELLHPGSERTGRR